MDQQEGAKIMVEAESMWEAYSTSPVSHTHCKACHLEIHSEFEVWEYAKITQRLLGNDETQGRKRHKGQQWFNSRRESLL